MTKHYSITAAQVNGYGGYITKSGLYFGTVMRGHTEGGVLLYAADDPGNISDKAGKPVFKIPFPDSCRTGDEYGVLISGLPKARYGYRYYRDGVDYPDPNASEMCWFSRQGTAFAVSLPQEEAFAADSVLPEKSVPQRPAGKDLYDWNSRIFYQLHIRGFSMQNKTVPAAERGRISGLVRLLPYIRSLGVTTILLMPPYEPVLERNYWGYGDGYYRIPRRTYISGNENNTREEFLHLVGSVHEAGMELFVQLSFPPEVSFERARTAVRDYAGYFGVDGLHLLGDGGLVSRLLSDPVLADLPLISAGFDGRQISQEESQFYGRSSGQQSHLAVCGHQFKQYIRCFVKGDAGMLQPFLRQFLSVPARQGAIRYVANNDGFTLADLVSYSHRHNEDNGEENRDGSPDNFSWNCGEEGKSRKAPIRKLRMRQRKNFLTLLMFSPGTPLLYAGDEHGNSQSGNNNAWNQDNPTGWTDWPASKEAASTEAYIKDLIRLRKELGFGTGRPFSLHGITEGNPDFGPESRTVGICYPADGDKPAVYLAVNMHWTRQELALPSPGKGRAWVLCLDTYKEPSFAAGGIALKEQNHTLVMERSVQLYISADISPESGT